MYIRIVSGLAKTRDEVMLAASRCSGSHVPLPASSEKFLRARARKQITTYRTGLNSKLHILPRHCVQCFSTSAWPAAVLMKKGGNLGVEGVCAQIACNRALSLLNHSAHTVPIQCPYSAHTVPIVKTHSAHTFFLKEISNPIPI